MLYSAATKTIIYPNLPDPERILTVLPEARRLQGSHIIVPHTMRNMQTVRHLGLPALSPILTEYDFPHAPNPNWKDVPEQRQMAAFMTLHPRCFNLSDMGTGKTLAALWGWDYLMSIGAIKRVLILAPLSTIYRVWDNEIFQHLLSRRSATIVYGDRQKRINAAGKDTDFYIINHDGLGVGSHKGNRGMVIGELAKFIRDNPEIDAIGVDEGSVYKDGTTNRYKVLRQVIDGKTYVWWFTGTPTPVDPTNAWSQARAVRKDYGESFISLRDRTMLKISQFKWVPKREGTDIAAQVLQPAIRFERSQLHNLPDVMIRDLDVELSPNQKKAYDELKKTLRAQVGAGQINAINEVTLRGKLIQIACGAVYGKDHEVHRVDCGPRLDVLEEVIEQSSHKLLIFAPLTSVINMLYQELRTRYTVEKVTGEVSAKRRNEIFRAFQEDQNPRIIVADPGCMAHGLTLTAADSTVWFGPTDKPEVYQQANKRMDRPGQKNSMLIARLSATPIEREIFRRLDTREKMQGLILTMVKEG